VIVVENTLHGTRRELLDANVGDTIPAHRAKRIRLELCGVAGCSCGPLGDYGPQQGLIVVEIGGGAVFISPTGDDFEGMSGHCHPKKNASESITGGQHSDDDARSDKKALAEPNPVEGALSKLLTLRDSLDELPDHVCRWLQEAITKYLRGESPTLDQALCLCQPIQGTTSANIMYKYKQRNEYLKRAANFAAPGQRPWPQAKKLAGAIRDYYAAILPSGAVHDCIEAAHQTKLRIPGSVTGLADILCER
jgi:hypothetical protein